MLLVGHRVHHPKSPIPMVPKNFFDQTRCRFGLTCEKLQKIGYSNKNQLVAVIFVVVIKCIVVVVHREYIKFISIFILDSTVHFLLTVVFLSCSFPLQLDKRLS